MFSALTVRCPLCHADVSVHLVDGLAVVEARSRCVLEAHAEDLPALSRLLEARVSRAWGSALPPNHVWSAIYSPHGGLEMLVRSGRKRR